MSHSTKVRFAGVWTVTREIEDFAAARTGRFRGLARITATEDGLRYAEYGTLTLGTARMQASRVYIWVPDGATGVRVLFEDGRPFHRFDWGRTLSTDAHQCEADHYAVRYNFGAEGWHVHWRVTGPAKDYAATSRFLRPVQGDVAAGAR